MSAREAILTSSRLVVVIGLVALGGCEKSPAQPPAQPIVEQPPAPQVSEAVPLPQTTEMPALPAPKVERVQEAVKRIFKDAVMIDSSRKPSFLVGDFNGDLSQDLAVVLKPAEGKISDLNQEFPSWIAREPLNEILLPKSKILAQPVAANPAAGQIIRFHQGDVLLAIIHGYGPKGWQDPEATQTHLLRDVVGANMAILPLKEAAKIYKRVKPFPNIYGDLIQQTLIGQSGFLHFAGGMYAWYDPKNYKAAPAPAHSGMSGMR